MEGKEVNKDMRNKFVSLSAIALFALSLTVVGCGKKEEPAPPPPPPAPAPAAPAGPEGQLNMVIDKVRLGKVFFS
jgi:hypothetical protein